MTQINPFEADYLPSFSVARERVINLQRLAKRDAQRTQHFGALPERAPVQGDLFDGWPDEEESALPE